MKCVPNVLPGTQPEVCGDGLDNDCNGKADSADPNAIGMKTFYRDRDRDGYGRDDDTVRACAAPTEYAARGGDCNDSDARIHPGAREVCNGIDDNCDGKIDEADPLLDLTTRTTFYFDGDGDGYGGTENYKVACAAPAGYVAIAGDCDDMNASINPGATELCNGIDDNCNGSRDESFTRGQYSNYLGKSCNNGERGVCRQSGTYVCDAQDPTRTRCDAPAGVPRVEVCDGEDNDCDGTVDDGCPVAGGEIRTTASPL